MTNPCRSSLTNVYYTDYDLKNILQQTSPRRTKGRQQAKPHSEPNGAH